MSDHNSFLSDIEKRIPRERIYTDELHRIAWGTDAGCYRITPKTVIRSSSEEEVSQVLAAAARYGVPVTFRAAGTSLSGQSISGSVLLVAGKNWEKWSVSPGAESITLQPGLVGGEVNRILKAYGRRFGPDPASIGSCMVGGIVANNASGMSCGTHANSDRTLISARIVFADGSILDTADEASRTEFARGHREMLDALAAIRKEIREDEKLRARLEYKYSIKNVTGLNLRPFLEYDDDFELIAHLMVGSEGTLGFVSEVTMRTLPIEPFSACAMIYFPDKRTAARAVLAMKPLSVSAAELLDLRTLTSVSDPHLESCKCPDLTAVLTQTCAESEEQLRSNIDAITRAVSAFELVEPVRFTRDAAEAAHYWALRSGIFPTVGALRREGTTCIIEDVAFHIDDLPQATADLSDLLDKHGYDDSCIYGHALEGNFHFIINQSFETDADIARYEAMIRDVAQMVAVRYDGSLKAEHGTGRNMAPFVSLEWGEHIYSIMKRVKQAFDPSGLLNPGVIFNDDPECFIRDLKTLPQLKAPADAPAQNREAFAKLNKCIECGFCEVNCVSCGYALSSRTRIAVRRSIASLEADTQNPESLSLAGRLRVQYLLPGDELCAGDGLCSMSCPMGINVADLTHELRRQRTPASSLTYKGWNWAAKHFALTGSSIRGLLHLAEFGRFIMGDKLMAGLCSGLHRGLGIPLWTPSTPRAYRFRPAQAAGAGSVLRVVYLPSCFNRMMGLPAGVKGLRPLVEETLDLLHKAGCEVIFPEGMDSLCCGTIWESKGMPDIAERKLAETEAALLKASAGGRYPILCDQSPCLHHMRTHIKSLKLYEPAEFILTFLLDRLRITRTDEPVAIHVTCSMRLMGLKDTLYSLASLCSSRVLIPEGVGCCGFAGDKGMTHPGLNDWALRKLRPLIEEAGIKYGYSNSRTCEIGLSSHSGIPYVSIVYLVNAHSEALSRAEKITIIGD